MNKFLIGSLTVTGSPFDYTNWLPNPPIQYQLMECVAAGAYPGYKYGWTDENCDEKLSFICEEKIRQQSATTEDNGLLESSTGATTKNNFQYLVNIAIPCAVIGSVTIVISVLFYIRHKRKDHTPID